MCSASGWLNFFLFILVAVSVPEPIAYYPLDKIHGTSEINDRQPEGTPVGVSLAPGPGGLDGGSYQFTGQEDSYIEFPNNGGLDVRRSITISFWVYIEARFTGNAQIVTYSSTEHGSDYVADVGVTIFDGIVRFIYYISWAKAFFHARDRKPFAQDVAAWRHVAASYDYDTGYARLWVDGEMVAENKQFARVNLVTNGPIILAKAPSHGSSFKGRITQLKIFDVALTDEQINKMTVGAEGGEGNVYLLKLS